MARLRPCKAKRQDKTRQDKTRQDKTVRLLIKCKWNVKLLMRLLCDLGKSPLSSEPEGNRFTSKGLWGSQPQRALPTHLRETTATVGLRPLMDRCKLSPQDGASKPVVSNPAVLFAEAKPMLNI